MEDTRAGSAQGVVCQAPMEAKQAAEKYIERARASNVGAPKTWQSVCQCGGQLVAIAGSVTKAAESLWEVREEKGLNNLKDVEDKYLDTPCLCQGCMSSGLSCAECGGSKAHQSQGSPKWTPQPLTGLQADLERRVPPSSPCRTSGCRTWPCGLQPFRRGGQDAARQVNYPRQVRCINATADKEWHPPAIQPKHEQIARLVLKAKAKLPGVAVLMSKKDVAGAFRFLWVDPQDVELFAGDLPWAPETLWTVRT